MSYGDPLPGKDHVTRGCSRGYDNGEVTASAFAMRERERKFLRISVDWVECLYTDPSAQNPEGSAGRLAKMPALPPYAVLKVGDIREVRLGDLSLDANEFKNERHPCHCAITGFSGASASSLSACCARLQVSVA